MQVSQLPGRPKGLSGVRGDDVIMGLRFLLRHTSARICLPFSCCLASTIFAVRPHRLAGLGHRPFTAVTRVRISLGTPFFFRNGAASCAAALLTNPLFVFTTTLRIQWSPWFDGF